jgi:hypothetical protein
MDPVASREKSSISTATSSDEDNFKQPWQTGIENTEPERRVTIVAMKNCHALLIIEQEFLETKTGNEVVNKFAVAIYYHPTANKYLQT